MKYSNLRAFEKHLIDASPSHLAPVYMILAKDPFVRRTAFAKLTDRLIADPKQRELALKVFDADQHHPAQIMEEFFSMGFFSKQKIIAIHNAEKLIKAVDQFTPCFERPIQQTHVILCAPAVASNTNLYKRAEKAGVILELLEEKPWEKEKSMQEWVQIQASAQKKKLDAHTAQFLVKQMGTDQASLQQELEKLICYCGDRSEITIKDVSDICSSVNIETIWQLGEAIFQRNAATALKISKGMLEDGTAFLALLRQIRSQFETEFQIAAILAAGGQASDVTVLFPYMKGAILERHIQSAQRYGKQKLKEGLLLIDATELKTKNSIADADILNEWLIIKLTQSIKDTPR